MNGSTVRSLPDTDENHARINREVFLMQAIARYFNAAGSFSDFKTVMKAFITSFPEYEFSLPPNWYLLDTLQTVSEEQNIFVNRTDDTVLVIVPDQYAEEMTLDQLGKQLD